MENLKIEDLVKGKIYRYDYTNKYAIAICSESKTTRTLSIVYSDNQYYKSNTVSAYKFKKATEEEKHWLNCCIKKNEFVPYEKAMETFNNESNPPFKKGDFVYLEKHYKHNTETQDYSTKLPLNTKLEITDVNFVARIFDNNEKEWTIYLKEDISNLGHPAVKFKLFKKNQQNTQQYEVGKWYKWKSGDIIDNYYLKCSSFTSDLFRYSEYINSSTNTFTKDNGNYPFEKIGKKVDLEVIQQYLPEGHVDKIAKNAFVKDDYIVVLQKPNGNLEYLPPNFCFKQYKNFDTLFAVKSIIDNETSCSDVTFLDKTTWRYATKEEISEYDRIGKPFDVSILVKQESKQSKFNFKGVHCKTQEEWNFVISKYNPKKLESSSFNAYASNSFIIIKILNKSKDNTWLGCYGNVTIDKDTEYYSFNEWCNKFGHSPDFMNKKQEIPGYVECIEWQGYSHKKGQIYELRNGYVSCETNGTPTCYEDFKHRFTPSSKKAFDAQFLLSKGTQYEKVSDNYTSNYITGVDPYQNETTIEIGDEVEVTEQYRENDAKVGSRGIVVTIDSNSDIKYYIKNEAFPKQKSSWCINVKLISKAKNNTTHVNKKVDNSLPENKNLITTKEKSLAHLLGIKKQLPNKTKRTQLTIIKPKQLKLN